VLPVRRADSPRSARSRSGRAILHGLPGGNRGSAGQSALTPGPATLHLLREASIERAVAAFPEAEAIYARNIEPLNKLGLAGWQALWRKP